MMSGGLGFLIREVSIPKERPLARIEEIEKSFRKERKEIRVRVLLSTLHPFHG